MELEVVGWWLAAAVAVAGAVGMISSKNPVHSALWLVVSFVAVAVIYLVLAAPVLFAIQMIVYAGAIMVLFLFVVMFFMAPSARRWLRPPLKSQTAIGVLFVLLFVTMLGLALNLDGVSLGFASAGEGGLPAAIGNPKPLGIWLFNYHVLPFELTSILLLAALLGAMLVARDERSEGRLPVEHHAPQADEGDVVKEASV